jgi:hypothetical protein
MGKDISGSVEIIATSNCLCGGNHLHAGQSYKVAEIHAQKLLALGKAKVREVPVKRSKAVSKKAVIREKS